jgi:hypothetical protein
LLAKTFKEVIKIGDESLSQMRLKAKDDPSIKARYLKVSGVMSQALLYLEIFGTITSYLFFDSYRFEPICEAVSSQKTFIKLLLALLMDYSKLLTLQRQVNKQRWKDSKLVTNYA